MYGLLIPFCRIGCAMLGGVGTPHQPQVIQKQTTPTQTVKEEETVDHGQKLPESKPQVELTTTDHSQVTETPRLDQKPLLEIEEHTKVSGQLPSEGQVQTLKTVSQMLDKHIDAPIAPPLPTTGGDIKPDQQERLLKTATQLVHASVMPEEQISKLSQEQQQTINSRTAQLEKLPQLDQEFLKNLVTRMGEPENYKPQPGEVKEVQRILQDATKASLHSGSLVDTSSGKVTDLNELDKMVSKKQLDTALEGSESTQPQPHHVPPPQHDAPVIQTDMAGVIANNFTGIVSDLDKSVFKGKVYDRAEETARQMTASIAPNSELARSLSTKTDAELREMITESMGLIKSKHEGKSFEELPKNKQKLVNAILEGMKSGLPMSGLARELDKAQTDEAREKLNDRGVAMGRNMIRSADPKGDYVFRTSLKTEAELKSDVIRALKLPNPDQLTPHQEQLVTSIVRGIQEGLPNKASGETVSIPCKEDAPGNVPRSITIGNTTYGDPKYLAEGAGGRVLLYTNPRDPEDQVVIKEALGLDAREAMIKELNAHHDVEGEGGHPNVVGLKGAVSGPNDTLYMALQVIRGPNLEKVKDKVNELRDQYVLSPSDDLLLRQFCNKGANEGLKYINESQDYMHRDIKLENMMYDTTTKQVVFVDFGTATGNEVSHEGALGSPAYMAPETLRDREGYDKSSDVWSLGNAMHEMQTGERVNQDAFNTSDEGTINTRLGATQMDKSSSFGKVMSGGMEIDPQARLTPSQMGQSKYFTDSIGSDDRARELLDRVDGLIKLEKGLAKAKDEHPVDNEKVQDLESQVKEARDGLQAFSTGTGPRTTDFEQRIKDANELTSSRTYKTIDQARRGGKLTEDEARDFARIQARVYANNLPPTEAELRKQLTEEGLLEEDINKRLETSPTREKLTTRLEQINQRLVDGFKDTDMWKDLMRANLMGLGVTGIESFQNNIVTSVKNRVDRGQLPNAKEMEIFEGAYETFKPIKAKAQEFLNSELFARLDQANREGKLSEEDKTFFERRLTLARDNLTPPNEQHMRKLQGMKTD